MFWYFYTVSLPCRRHWTSDIGSRSGYQYRSTNGTRHSVYLGEHAEWEKCTHLGEFNVYSPDGYTVVYFSVYTDSYGTVNNDAHDVNSLVFYNGNSDSATSPLLVFHLFQWSQFQ